MVEFHEYKKLGLVICPYDETHVIRQEWMSRHLIICARSNRNVVQNFTVCEYNHCHRIRRGDGGEHYKTCKDKKAQDQWLERNKMCIKKGDTSLPKYKDIEIKEDNWDNEVERFISERHCRFIPDLF
jgi:hypothetical protein